MPLAQPRLEGNKRLLPGVEPGLNISVKRVPFPFRTENCESDCRIGRGSRTVTSIKFPSEKILHDSNVSVHDYIAIDPIRNNVAPISSVSMSADYEPISTQLQRLVNRTFEANVTHCQCNPPALFGTENCQPSTPYAPTN